MSVCPAQVCLKPKALNLYPSLSVLSQIYQLRSVPGLSRSALLPYFLGQTEPKLLRLIEKSMQNKNNLNNPPIKI